MIDVSDKRRVLQQFEFSSFLRKTLRQIIICEAHRYQELCYQEHNDPSSRSRSRVICKTTQKFCFGHPQESIAQQV